MAGLLDFFQSASNAAASNVSAPVDGLAWLMRKLGAPIPDDPMMGSNWMEKKGLTRPVKQSGYSLAGETAGMVAPMLAAAKAPQIARGMLQMGENAMAPKTLNPQTGAIVWHGSPHKFDKFDSSKIGTGEGAQAYGHGLYLAENPSVATEYRRTLSAGIPDVFVNGKRVAGSPLNSAANRIAMSKDAITKDDLAAHFAQRIQELSSSSDPLAKAGLNEAKKALATLGKAKDVAVKYDGTAGQLYKVDLPDEHIAKMLDWDKPLSQQTPDVQKLLEPLGYSSKAQVSQYDDDLLAALNGSSTSPLQKIHDPMGSDIARGGGLFDSKAQIDKANRLRELGIPGIRYLDGGSRGAGGGTSNFVVFPGNEDILQILERNGQGLLGR